MNKNQTNTCEHAIPAGTPERQHDRTGGYQKLPIHLLTHFPEHPFKLYTGKRLRDMVNSIAEHGIITPVIVRDIKGRFQILSGHNRVRAAELAGYVDVPVIIKTNLSDAEAKLFVTETNLMQRAFSDLSHSEKALSLAQHYEMLKRQGKQKDVLNEIESLLTPNDSGVQIEHLKSRDKMGSEYGLSATNVTRYIRISKLNSGLLEQLDNGKLGFNPAYQISFIEDSILQIQIAELIQNGSKVDLKKSEQLRKYFANGNLTNKMVARILSNNDSPKSKSFKIRAEIIERFFEDDLPDCEIEGIIVTALQFYNDNRQDVVNNDDSDYDDDSEYGDD